MSPSPDPAAPFLQVNDLSKSFLFGNQTIEVLKGINLEVRQGEILAMLGASGAGKSTLLHILGTLDRPTRGTVFYESQDIFRLSEHELALFRNRRIGFVFQFHHLLPEFTALENTYLPSLMQKRPIAQCIEEASTLLSGSRLGPSLASQTRRTVRRANNNEWPWHVRLFTARTWSWQTNQREIWTRMPAKRCLPCCES